jgi:hypothetical protein
MTFNAFVSIFFPFLVFILFFGAPLGHPGPSLGPFRGPMVPLKSPLGPSQVLPGVPQGPPGPPPGTYQASPWTVLGPPGPLPCKKIDRSYPLSPALARGPLGIWGPLETRVLLEAQQHLET